jgi:HTH-type transcriptional regulator / antitoxin HipB
MAFTKEARSFPNPLPPSGRLAQLAEQVRLRRKALGLTQAALADLAGCSARLVRALEGGRHAVRLDKFLDVLAALGLELAAQPRSVS